jgi:RNA polymerase sigma-70 factor, ECF subfamily
MTMPTPRPPVDASDSALARRLADGDAGALAALYDRYSRSAFALACRVSGDPASAEEVVREVFLELWRDPARSDPAGGGLPGRLLASTHHRAVAAARRAGTTAARPDADLAHAASPGAGEHGRRVRAALAALPPPHREAVTLAYYTGCSQRQIAERTGAPVGTVRSWLLAGMQQLRDVLDRAVEAGGDR